MQFLASDTLRGRGSATRDEHLAALYAASLFASFGLEPGGDNGSFVQKAPVDISRLPPRMQQRLQAFEAVPRTETWNVVGILPGSLSDSLPGSQKQTNDRTTDEAILLTAHLDHLGVGPAVSGDSIYNGADDDASGTTAVIELARALSRGPRPKRTILFVLFGSEEIGGMGNRYFLEHPPVPLDHIAANLEFEMIGRPDPAVPAGSFWLTGFERSNLGPELIRHGAHLAADPHPAEHFFQRSDNYALALRGIVAQTISSFNLHKDYHQPSDELSRIDFPYMTTVIESMVKPVEWLADTSWKPAWNPGGQPKPQPPGHH
ncbi:M20/M25/M40 family metallo-hydrolase [Acidipila sp. 4G-K13]|uniref:M20/M25/M40 family metallo-hydrolase n=2 Tax=Paracidobacterium acidisoli TaxID=2303751 RepID=A0A372IKZ3_9BACT|nr:M20/M25/M40 family metallo-hydrolase [Paracidobacterium acidisoli]